MPGSRPPLLKLLFHVGIDLPRLDVQACENRVPGGIDLVIDPGPIGVALGNGGDDPGSENMVFSDRRPTLFRFRQPAVAETRKAVRVGPSSASPRMEVTAVLTIQPPSARSSPPHPAIVPAVLHAPGTVRVRWSSAGFRSHSRQWLVTERCWRLQPDVRVSVPVSRKYESPCGCVEGQVRHACRLVARVRAREQFSDCSIHGP